MYEGGPFHARGSHRDDIRHLLSACVAAASGEKNLLLLTVKREEGGAVKQLWFSLSSILV